MKVAYYKRLRLLLTLCSGTVAALMGLIKAVRHPNFNLLCLSVCKNRSILVLSSGSPLHATVTGASRYAALGSVSWLLVLHRVFLRVSSFQRVSY